MDKRGIFTITFFIISLVVLVMVYEGAPEGIGVSKFSTPDPKTVEIGGINFTIAVGYLSDDNLQQISIPDSVSSHVLKKSQQSFRQNEILLLDIAVLELDKSISLDEVNDGSYRVKSINGIEGLFKSEEVSTSAGFVKNSHSRYYFNYIEDNKLVMIQCDNLRSIENMLS